VREECLAAVPAIADPVQSMLATDATKLRGGKFVPVRIGIYPFAHAFRPGSRIRVAIEALPTLCDTRRAAIAAAGSGIWFNSRRRYRASEGPDPSQVDKARGR
jgi:predicted acyl esterase